jgi:hypothetical protein
MQDIILIDIDCSVNKVVGYVRGLPLLVGLKSVKSISSELWFEASVNLVDTVAEVVVSTCNATLHSKYAHKTTLLHNSIAIQHSNHTLFT